MRSFPFSLLSQIGCAAERREREEPRPYFE